MEVVALLDFFLNGISGNVGRAVIAAVINAIVAYLLERKFYKNRFVHMVLTLATAIVATIFSFLYLTDPISHQPWTVIVVFLTSVTLWAVFFHIFSVNYGHYISSINLGDWSALTRNWVKSIDYIYLTLSTLSVLRIVVSAVPFGDGTTYFNALAAVLLGFAVALRITRTSIEIFGWDKPRPQAA